CRRLRLRGAGVVEQVQAAADVDGVDQSVADDGVAPELPRENGFNNREQAHSCKWRWSIRRNAGLWRRSLGRTHSVWRGVLRTASETGTCRALSPVIPPSTVTAIPVMKVDRGLARKAMAEATAP